MDDVPMDMMPPLPNDALCFLMREEKEDIIHWIRFAIKLKELGKDPYEYLKALEYVSPGFPPFA
jgi:hypothetical protein